MRHRILILLFLGGLMALAGCKEMPGLISHNIVLGEAEHGKKLYKGAKDCTACHGVNLKGQGYIPGCFGCHGVMWNKDDHLVKLGSTMHKRGYLDAPNNCGPCHGGTSLKKENIQGKLRPGCYDCHGDKWTGIASHSISKGGYLHATAPCMAVSMLVRSALRGMSTAWGSGPGPLIMSSPRQAFRFIFQNKEDEAAFQYLPGQFADFRSSGRENRRSGSPHRRRSPVIWNSPSRRRGW